ncbi:MAG: hypothetical protein KDD33_00025 [Bdellovibrionales bacterium]|nr:hypothetical protein [Bdellovibrionales bacterium]
MAHNKLELLFDFISQSFPKSFPQIRKENLINENLFSPFVIDLPVEVLKNVQSFVKRVYEIKNSSAYQEELPPELSFKSFPDYPSILTCFDFHYTPEMGLKLIEINTNASLYMPIVLQGCAQGETCCDPTMDHLYASFKAAFDFKDGDAINILDEIPQNEGLYFEFLLYKEWFESLGHPCEILSLADYPKNKANNIYNRYNDFYLSEEKSKTLREDYLSGQVRFSPNPREYALLADKRRMNLLRKHLLKNDETLAKIIPETFLFGDFDSADEIWAQRKKFFFKPSQSYGSKGVFNGRGISRKAFEGIYSPDFLAQELAPPGKMSFEYEGEAIEMKFDLRFFTFAGQVQNYGARIYQGQTTNVRTPLGGITPLRFQPKDPCDPAFGCVALSGAH